MKSPQSRTAAAMLDARDNPLSKRRSHRQGRGRGRRTRGTKMRHDLLPLPSHSAIPPRLGRAVLHNVLVIGGTRSEEHTSELRSLMRSSYAVFCLNKKKTLTRSTHHLTRQKHTNR